MTTIDTIPKKDEKIEEIIFELRRAVLALNGFLIKTKEFPIKEENKKSLIIFMEVQIKKIKKARKHLLKSIHNLQKLVKKNSKAKPAGETLFKLAKALKRVIDRTKVTAKERDELSKEEIIKNLRLNEDTIKKTVGYIEKVLNLF